MARNIDYATDYLRSPQLAEEIRLAQSLLRREPVMALLGLNLGGLLGGVTDTVDDLLGVDVGNVLEGVLPSGLVDDLGSSLDGVLGGDPTGLIGDLVDANVLDLATLQDVLGGGSLDLTSLDTLLSGANAGGLEDLLDDIFDNGLLGLGTTVLDTDALGQLGPLDLASTATFVTSLVGTILDVAGDATDVGLVLDSLLSGDDDLKGNEDANTIDGRAGADSIQGFGGNDTLHGGVGNDTVRGGADDDRVFGDDGNDQLFGDAGKDILNGGAGADVMRGGLGDDTYYVDSASDVVTESSDQGRDVVYSSVKYALGANVEGVSLLGTADLNAAGNSLDNTLYGNDGVNKLAGGAGRDVLFGRGDVDILEGGKGADVFRYAHASDSTLDRAGRDIIRDFDASDRLDFRNVDADTGVNGDQAFEFIGSAKFHGTGDGEIRFAFGQDFTLVSVDIDGNGSLDMAVQLDGIHKLTASDFLL